MRSSLGATTTAARKTGSVAAGPATSRFGGNAPTPSAGSLRSNLAGGTLTAGDKTGRVAATGPDAARFGGTETTAPASSLKNGTAGKTARVSSAFGAYGPQQPAAGTVAADKTGRLAQAPDVARFGTDQKAAVGRTGLAAALATSQGATIGRQSSVAGVYANAGTNSTPARALTPAYDKDVMSVTKAGAGWTQVSLRDGTVETRKGTRAARNNNPGNIEAGKYAKAAGAVGTDGRFAVFSTKEQGLKAMEGLVFGAAYKDKTIAQAINKYAPPHENNTGAYAAAAAKAAGVSVNTRVRDLTPSQRTALIGGMTTVEDGNGGYTTTTVKEGRVTTVSSALGKTSRPSAAATMATQTGAPISNAVREAAVRVGADPQATADYAAKMGMTPAAAAAAMRPASSYPGYKAPTYIGRDGKPVAAPAPAAQVAAAPAGPDPVRFGGTEPTRTVSTTFAEKYLGTTPASTPARPSTPATAKVERSLPDKVLAGAIDVGVGMIPGIGTAAGLYGIAAPMLGMPSIGDMALNLRDRNEFDLNASLAGKTDKGGSSERLSGSLAARNEEAQSQPDEAPPAVAVASFEEKYLGFSDPTPRPTPEQKWGGIGANSAAYRL